VNRLFVRILVWYAATLAVALAIFVALLMSSRDRLLIEVARSRGSKQAAFLQESAVAAYKQGGAEGLQSLAERVERELQVEIRLASLDMPTSVLIDLTTGLPLVLKHPIPAVGEPPFESFAGNEQTVVRRVSPSWVFIGRNPRVVFQLPGLLQRNVLRFLAAFAVAGLLCLVLARQLTRPIVDLQHATRRLANGDTSYRIEVTRHDELGRLEEDFNHMSAQLQMLVERRDELLRRVSHELRSPLARLSASLELLRQQVHTAWPHLEPDFRVAESIQRCDREVARLNDLIGQLLTYSRITQMPSVEMKPFDLERLVLDVAADVNYEAEAADCSVEVVECFPCLTTGDSELLRSAIENVLRNAVYHTRPQTRVTMSMQAHGDQEVAVVITDNGPGVPPESLDRIFEPFFRLSLESGSELMTAHATEQRRWHGAGLGLSIAKRAINLHRGRINAVNGLSSGLVVSIVLPISTPGAPRATASRSSAPGGGRQFVPTSAPDARVKINRGKWRLGT